MQDPCALFRSLQTRSRVRAGGRIADQVAGRRSASPRERGDGEQSGERESRRQRVDSRLRAGRTRRSGVPAARSRRPGSDRSGRPDRARAGQPDLPAVRPVDRGSTTDAGVCLGALLRGADRRQGRGLRADAARPAGGGDRLRLRSALDRRRRSHDLSLAPRTTSAARLRERRRRRDRGSLGEHRRGGSGVDLGRAPGAARASSDRLPDRVPLLRLRGSSVRRLSRNHRPPGARRRSGVGGAVDVHRRGWPRGGAEAPERRRHRHHHRQRSHGARRDPCGPASSASTCRPTSP